MRGGRAELQRRRDAVLPDLPDLRPDLRHELVLVGVYGIAACAPDEELFDVDGDEGAVLAISERLCVRQSPVGGLRSVTSPEDRLEHRWPPFGCPDSGR